MQKTLELLRERVKLNLETIHKNQEKIKILLKDKCLSSVQRQEYQEKYNANKHMLAENNDFINMQLHMINFLNKYKHTELFEQPDEPDEAEIAEDLDYFSLTIQGTIPFDKEHPYFKDETFFKRLLNYYKELENYEMCEVLVKSR